MKNNIKIAYTLAFLWRLWFWLGIWVFNYLRYTDYAGIGLLEAVMITTSTIGEIPTGVIADMVGKKRTIIFAFALSMLGNLIQAVAPNYAILMLSVVTMTVGGAFLSGSFEALIYDSLKEDGNADNFKRVISRITTMQNLGMAVAGIAGGYLYQIHHSLPFYFVAAAHLIGMVLSFRLVEPTIDTEKYSWKEFMLQNKEGFKQLFSSKSIAYLSLLLLVPSAFMIATENVINDATAVQLGFNSVQLGIFATILYLFGVFVSEQSDKAIYYLGSKYLYLSIIVVYMGSLLIMPKAAMIVGAILLLIRFGSATLFSNYESVRLNEVIDSKYRATTLSTFSLLRNIPYIFAATGIGALVSAHGAKQFSMYFGIIFMLMMIILFIIRPIFKK